MLQMTFRKRLLSSTSDTRQVYTRWFTAACFGDHRTFTDKEEHTTCSTLASTDVKVSSTYNQKTLYPPPSLFAQKYSQAKTLQSSFYFTRLSLSCRPQNPCTAKVLQVLIRAVFLAYLVCFANVLNKVGKPARI